MKVPTVRLKPVMSHGSSSKFVIWKLSPITWIATWSGRYQLLHFRQRLPGRADIADLRVYSCDVHIVSTNMTSLRCDISSTVAAELSVLLLSLLDFFSFSHAPSMLGLVRSGCKLVVDGTTDAFSSIADDEDLCRASRSGTLRLLPDCSTHDFEQKK
jgi:hypothetical protein